MRGSVLLGGQLKKNHRCNDAKFSCSFFYNSWHLLIGWIFWQKFDRLVLFVLEEFMFVSKLGYQCRINNVLKLYQSTPCKDKCTSIRRNLQNDTKYSFQSFMSQPLNFSLADQQVSLKRFILDYLYLGRNINLKKNIRLVKLIRTQKFESSF